MDTLSVKAGGYCPLDRFYPNKYKLEHYLERLLETADPAPGGLIILPSLLELSRELECSTFDLHKALSGLHRRGYEYTMAGIDRPIRLIRIPDFAPPEIPSNPFESKLLAHMV